MSIVSVRELEMTYQAPVRQEGMGAAMRALFRPQYREVKAVQRISFEIDAGTIVGFIGPNGAGKTTTLKILSGILHPTGGTVRVLDAVPWLRQRRFLHQIAMIRGSQPLGGPAELTVMDAMRFQQLLYDVSADEFRRNLAELDGMLELGPLLQRQVRALSLGERMRCGLALSLLYRPRVLFLDEPTLGLDVSAVGMVRGFFADYVRETGATALLTSHYMTDVETLCKRIILIDAGSLRFDGDLAQLARVISPFKVVKLQLLGDDAPDWSRFGELLDDTDGTVTLRVRREHTADVMTGILTTLAVADVTIEEPPLEVVMDQVYRGGLA